MNVNNECKLCGTEYVLFHKGVRDNANIDVMRCPKCGLLQLSTFEQIDNSYYKNELMLKNQYNGITGNVEDESWDEWIEETREDDERRYRALAKMCKGKKVCDFGCGNGGFLRKIAKDAICIVGIELDKNARRNLEKESIPVYENISEIKEQFDVITMFQVIEHLDDPDHYLQLIRKKLLPGGKLVIETPNADDALISYYQCEAFKSFTFWSAHLMIYNSANLAALVQKQGFGSDDNGQIQRYPLSNHMYWLTHGRPRGHKIMHELNCTELNASYEKVLRAENMCDTLFATFCK